jgi:hypothetical protein
VRVETCERMGTTRRTLVRRAFVALVLLLGGSAMTAPAISTVSIRCESSLAARGAGRATTDLVTNATVQLLRSAPEIEVWGKGVFKDYSRGWSG